MLAQILLPIKFWLLSQTHPGWKQKIKSTNVTGSVGNSSKNVTTSDYTKLQETIKELSELVSTRKDYCNLHIAN